MTEQKTTEDETYFINDVQASKRLGVSRITMQNWRARGEGPPFYKISRRVIYDWNEVEAWARSKRQGG